MPAISATSSSSSREIGELAGRAHRAAVGVDVLAQQRHFAHALVGEAGDLGEHVVERPRELFAARVRHDAVGAVLRAAFHDRDEGGRAFDARRRQEVELLDLGKADVDLRPRLRARRRRASPAAGAASAGRTRGRRRARARRSPRPPGWRRSRRRRSARPRAFRCLTRPRSLNTFSCAFSRTEQVLKRMRSAASTSVGRLVAVPPRAARRPCWPSRRRSSGSRRS